MAETQIQTQAEYSKTNWSQQQIITSENLNKIEDQLGTVTHVINSTTFKMTGATDSTDGIAGVYPPQPMAGDNHKFLRGDATWAAPDALEHSDNTNGQNNLTYTFVTVAPESDNLRKIVYLTNGPTINSAGTVTIKNHLAIAQGGITASGQTITAKTFSGSFSGDGSSITKLNADKISTGTVVADYIGELPASKITSGTFDRLRIPSMVGVTNNADGTHTKGEAGTVPAPTDANSLLAGSGTWITLGDGLKIEDKMLKPDIASWAAEEEKF